MLNSCQKNAEIEAAQRKRKKERIDRLIGKKAIKKRFITRTFDSFEVTEESRKQPQKCLG